ncbi:MAG TPA: helix-turn-helix transcriptional regulator [Nocardioides sp.]|nr:helix-turn-helix transcriptional regulator [Nocardioides sp.]
MLGRESAGAGGSPLVGKDRTPRTAAGGPTTWVVSPRLLVAQAVTAALTSVGAEVELHAWETFSDEVRASDPGAGPLHVVVVFDDLDSAPVVEEVEKVVGRDEVRVALVVPDPSGTAWGALLDEPTVDVIDSATSLSELADAVDDFTSGVRLLAPERRRALRAAWAEALDNRAQVVALVQTLSPQQMRVLELLASGHRVKEAASMMGVADGTVRSHVRALRAKLNVRTQLEAVAMLRQVHEPALSIPRPRPPAASEKGAVRRR